MKNNLKNASDAFNVIKYIPFMKHYFELRENKKNISVKVEKYLKLKYEQ